MKKLMKKETGFTIDEVIKENEENKPKKIRNRPLFYVKVSILVYI